MIDVLQDYRIFKMNGEKKQGRKEQVRKRGLPPLVQSKQLRGHAPLPDLFFS